MQFSHQCATETDLISHSQKLARALEAGCIIYLIGPLGAGKTTFTRGLLRGLGITEKVKSPTYTLVESYTCTTMEVIHFDLFRINQPEALKFFGVEEYFDKTKTCIIEWPEKGYPLLPASDLTCYIDFIHPGRKLEIKAQSPLGETILNRL